MASTNDQLRTIVDELTFRLGGFISPSQDPGVCFSGRQQRLFMSPASATHAVEKESRQGEKVMSMFDPVRVFQCPNCNETIDASALQCRFCSAPIDPDMAEAASAVMAKVNQACSDASFIKTTAWAILVAFAFRFVPIVSGLGSMAFLILLVAVPAMALRWWIKFARIVSSEADFRRARRTVAAIGIPVSILLVMVLAVLFLGLSAPFRNR